MFHYISKRTFPQAEGRKELTGIIIVRKVL